MKFYIQVNKEGYITDCIEYAYGDYISVDLPTPLPDGFISGAYKYLGDNDFELDESNLPKSEDDSLQLRADVDYIAIMTGVDLDV